MTHLVLLIMALILVNWRDTGDITQLVLAYVSDITAGVVLQDHRPVASD